MQRKTREKEEQEQEQESEQEKGMVGGIYRRKSTTDCGHVHPWQRRKRRETVKLKMNKFSQKRKKDNPTKNYFFQYFPGRDN